MQINKTRILVYAALGIGINVILGTAVSALKIPLLFLDTMGTVIVAVLFGPWWGAATGILTNLVLGVTSGPTAIFFGLVNAVIGLVVGYVALKYDFRKWYVALLTGIILSIIAPLIGTPIAVAVFGGLNGSGMDLIVLWLRSAGESVFASTFISRITGNIIDKIATCLLTMFILSRVPIFKTILINKKDKIDAAL